MSETMSRELERAIQRMFEETLGRRDGRARQQMWRCEDGYRVMHTTSRVEGGEHDGKYVVMLYKPEGRGARSGKASQWVATYQRGFATRKAALNRAYALFRQHSPRWNERHPKRAGGR